MNKSRISFGPGAASLILIVVILSMSVLGILALMNARSDSRLSARSVQVVQAGFTIGDLVLRPAMVGVAKGGPKGETPTTAEPGTSSVNEKDA